MEPVTLAVVSLAVLMLLLSFGVPIVFCFSGALAFMSIVGGVTMKGMMMWGLQQILSPTLLCIPLFIYAGSLMSESGIAKYLLEFVDVFVGRIRGGLGFVATLTCAILGAISGSTFTGLAATGNMLIPEMVSRGYPRAFATALITCSSILGVLIPPSTPMIIFGWVTGTNVLACFLSTVGPGIVTIIIFCGINFVLSRRFDLKLMPQLSKTEKRRQIAVRGWKALPALIMPVLILGHTPKEEVPLLIEHHITQAVTCQAKALEYSQEAVRCGGTLKVHIKVDTGMSRLGFLTAGEHFGTGVEAICAACRLPAGLAEQMTSEAPLETALDYPFNASMYVSSDLEGMFGKRAALAGNGALAELVTRPDAEEVIARALAAPAEAGEDPLRGVYLETFCAWLPELSGMAGV